MLNIHLAEVLKCRHFGYYGFCWTYIWGSFDDQRFSWLFEDSFDYWRPWELLDGSLVEEPDESQRLFWIFMAVPGGMCWFEGLLTQKESCDMGGECLPMSTISLNIIYDSYYILDATSDYVSFCLDWTFKCQSLVWLLKTFRIQNEICI